MRTLLIPAVALLIILGVLYVVWEEFGREPEGFGPGGDRVLVVYDEPLGGDSVARETVSAYSLAQLLCHFDVSVKLVSMGDYEEGMISSSAFAFYVGTKTGQPLPSWFLDEVFNTRTPVMWIAANLDRLAARHSMERFGFEVAGDTDDRLTNDVEYKGTRLAKVDLRTFGAEITRPDVASALAVARYVDEPLKPAQYGVDTYPGTPEGHQNDASPECPATSPRRRRKPPAWSRSLRRGPCRLLRRPISRRSRFRGLFDPRECGTSPAIRSRTPWRAALTSRLPTCSTTL
ncbi:MAG: hypothetical protein M5R36_20335 [Deltaproteobacteria bacterium]|nr:hypothetical protein [Deltaproteobacteria bacterium]